MLEITMKPMQENLISLQKFNGIAKGVVLSAPLFLLGGHYEDN